MIIAMIMIAPLKSGSYSIMNAPSQHANQVLDDRIIQIRFWMNFGDRLNTSTYQGMGHGRLTGGVGHSFDNLDFNISKSLVIVLVMIILIIRGRDGFTFITIIIILTLKHA